MTHLRAFLLLCLAAIPTSALGVEIDVTNPVWADVYWEVTGHTWAADVAAEPNQGTAFTSDMIDSFFMAQLKSAYPTALAGYGVLPSSTNVKAYFVYPDAHTDIPECVGVTPSPATGQMGAFQHNLAQFVQCAAALNTDLQQYNVIVDVILPPWIKGASGTNCLSDGGSPTDGGCFVNLYNDAQNTPAWYDYCLGMPMSAWNSKMKYVDAGGHIFATDGGGGTYWRYYASLPTESNCTGDSFVAFTYVHAHESIERTVDGNIADDCESSWVGGGWNFPSFLYGQAANYWAYPPYIDAGPSANCVPYDGGTGSNLGEFPPGPTMAAPTVKCCGSGVNMVTQVSLDNSHGRNNPPWDLPDGGNGLQGSLFVELNVQKSPSGSFNAGGEHFPGFLNPVGLGSIHWDSSGFVQINGFGSGYGDGGNVALPNKVITTHIYDTVWAKDNSNTSAAEHTAQWGFLGYTVASPSSPPLETFDFFGSAQGTSSCGLLGHYLASSVPIGDGTVILASDDPADYYAITTAGDGGFGYAYTPAHSGVRSVSVTSGVADASYTINVAPQFWPVVENGPVLDDNGNGAWGSVGGGQALVVSGNQLAGGVAEGLPNDVMYLDFGASLAGGGTVEVADASISIGPSGMQTIVKAAPSPLPNTVSTPGGAGEVLVSMYTDSITPISFTTYNYIVPGQPFVGVMAPTACASTNTYCWVTIRNADGSVDTSVPYYLLTGGGINSCFATNNTESCLCYYGDGGAATPEVTVTPCSSNGHCDAGPPVTQTISVPPAAAWNPLCDILPLLWWPTFYALPPGEVPYAYDSPYWVISSDPDPAWMRAYLPQIESWSSPYGSSGLSVQTLGAETMWNLSKQISGGTSDGYAVPETSAPEGAAYLCFGTAVSISPAGAYSSYPPDWSFTVQYPFIAPGIPAANYRVFAYETLGGYNASSDHGYWVEVGATTGSSSITASLYGEAIGSNYLTGPYALAYWSPDPCTPGY